MNLPFFKNPKQTQLFLLVLLILVASSFRLWQIRPYQIFLGDEGRDMIVMRNMILEMRPVFLGPTASVGGFYLGPIYYWMAAPALAAFMFDPVGPSILVAIFGIATVFLLYKFLRELVGFWPAILAGFLYATAPLIVRYSRSAWNPNPLPFFALLMIWSVYRGVKVQKWHYFAIAGACFGVAIQLHYLSVMLIPVCAVIIMINTNFKKWPFITVVTFIGSFITFLPFLLFEIKNHFPNFITIHEFVTRPSTHGYHATNFLWVVSNSGNILLENISSLKQTIFTKIAFWTIAIGNIFLLLKYFKNKEKRLTFSVGLIYFLGGLFFLNYYSGQIFDYYYGFMFPAPFVALGILISAFWKNIITRIVTVLVFGATIAYFVLHGFYTHPPNRLINQTESVADFVIEKSQKLPYNFALITDHNSDHAYRYFLEIKNRRPTQLEELVTDQLLVVCEGKCAPLGNPIWEIAGFGPGEIIGEWELPEIGIYVFKLTHWSGAPNPAGKPAQKGQ